MKLKHFSRFSAWLNVNILRLNILTTLKDSLYSNEIKSLKDKRMMTTFSDKSIASNENTS